METDGKRTPVCFRLHGTGRSETASFLIGTVHTCIMVHVYVSLLVLVCGLVSGIQPFFPFYIGEGGKTAGQWLYSELCTAEFHIYYRPPRVTQLCGFTRAIYARAQAQSIVEKCRDQQGEARLDRESTLALLSIAWSF